VFGILFVVLFLNTRYTGQDVIPWPVNAFFRIDLLAAVTSMAAARKILWFFWPLLLLIPLAVIFGRFFCGWICPMGGMLDLVGTRSRNKAPSPGGRLYPTGQVLLVIILLTGLLGVNIAGVADPMSLLIRSLAMGVVPPLERSVHAVFNVGYHTGGPVAAVTEPVYDLLSGTLLSFTQPRFRYIVLFLGLILGIVLLELRERRYWCRNLCPLGALMGITSALAPFGLRISESSCTACGRCEKVCPMAAIDGEKERHVRRKDCTLCYDCVPQCNDDAFLQKLEGAPVPDPGGFFHLDRRQFGLAAGSGVLLPLVMGQEARPDGLPHYFIRPPGSAPEDKFLELCLRCGECMRVCLTNGLQPALLEAGMEAIWTPRLVSRAGYCEYSCTLCGQVCPTGAIEHLDTVAKRQVTIGTAIIDKNSCIPFVRPEQCMVCEEHCPTPEKAIVFDEAEVSGPGGPVKVLQPRVIKELCIGCGICEYKCPLQGDSAIRMVRDGEDRSRPEEDVYS
jgi:ferredoxin